MLEALIVTTLAGLATMLGALLSLAVRKPGAKFMSLNLGFAAGVMIFVSFAGFLHHSLEEIGQGGAYLFFLVGLVAMFLLDVVVPHDYMAEKHAREGKGRMFRAGLLAALGIGIHNLPEGMAVFTGMLHGGARLGWAVAAAIALHNIPEGLAMAGPIYSSTGSRGKALGWSLLASLAEPAGALLAAAALAPFLGPRVMAGTLAVVAGIMVFIALDELLPAAREEGEEGTGHLGIVGVIAGMAVMGLGLWLLHTVEPHEHQHPGDRGAVHFEEGQEHQHGAEGGHGARPGAGPGLDDVNGHDGHDH
jgi:ZIP family zinc transporter